MSADVVAEAVAATVTLGSQTILDGPTLQLRAGAITLLVGPNGAGKTTLLRAFAGVLQLSGGHIRVGGRDPRREPEARALLALVPQEIALYPRLTVRENLETFAAFAGRPRRGAHIDDALAHVALDGDADRLVSALSGGLQRRVNIASALVAAPRLLLLDEPSAGLDVVARRTILGSLRDIASTGGIAVLMTTHDLDDAEAVADEVAVLQRGRLLAAGRPEALVNRAFPDACQRIDVLLATAPDAALATRLTAGRLRPLADRTHWRGYAAPGSAETLLAGIDARGLREVRVRRPGLEDAYTALVEEPARP